MPVGQIAGAALGGLSGAFANQKEGGKDTGNVFGMSKGDNDTALKMAQSGYDPNSFLAQRVNSPDFASNQATTDPIQGQLFGQGGALSDTLGQVKSLENQGYNLTPQDQTAYGQASGNIARQFGQSEQGLSQSLANRGLGSSNVAASKFSGLQGNKDEQLGQLQTQIANNRMQTTMQRLGQMQSFASSLGNQAQGAINSNRNFNMGALQNYEQQGRDAANLLGHEQNQANEGLTQQQQTSHGSSLSNALNGASIGGMMGGSMGGQRNSSSLMGMSAGGGAGNMGSMS